MKNKSDAVRKLGSKIREERKRQGLTQTELGHYAQTGINFISQLENGKASLRFDKVLDVMKVLGLQLRIEYGKELVCE